MPEKPSTGASYNLSHRIGAAKAKEITTYENFVEGYRNREDTSLLKPQTLVAGSHDVLIGTTGRVRSREGYYIDGAKSTISSSTRPLPDWEMGTGFIHHLRAGGLTNGTNGQLQIRYTDTFGALGTVNGTYWLPLLGGTTTYPSGVATVSGLTSTYFQSANYWDSTNLLAKLLLVNRTGVIWEWTGAIGTIASVTSSSITLNGTVTPAQLKFYSSGYVINNGIVYQYASISGQTLNLQGGTPSPVGAVLNSPVYQQPVSFTFASGTFTNTPSPATGFTCDLIGILKTSNQVMVASISNNVIYLSQAGTYTNYSQSTARLQYEGDMFTSVGNVTALVPEDSEMYVSAGQDEWYITDFTDTTITNQTTGATLVYENSQLQQLKTTSGQASISQYATTKIKNLIAYVSNEPIVNTLGIVANYLSVPQVADLSSPIVYDMNNYNFTDASIYYWKQRILVAIPKSGTVIIYNMTNPKEPFWEAPLTLPVSGFCTVGNTLIGHSYNTFESYVMFQGYSDRALNINATGNPINAVALFAFNEVGLRAKRKSFDKFFLEGYISPSTALNFGFFFRSPQNGLSLGQSFLLMGTNPIIPQGGGDDSLGKLSLGKDPLATDIPIPQQLKLPNYFAVTKLTLRSPFVSFQPAFYSNGVNQRWELLAYGSNAVPTSENENDTTF